MLRYIIVALVIVALLEAALLGAVAAQGEADLHGNPDGLLSEDFSPHWAGCYCSGCVSSFPSLVLGSRAGAAWYFLLA